MLLEKMVQLSFGKKDFGKHLMHYSHNGLEALLKYGKHFSLQHTSLIPTPTPTPHTLSATLYPKM